MILFMTLMLLTIAVAIYTICLLVRRRIIERFKIVYKKPSAGEEWPDLVVVSNYFKDDMEWLDNVPNPVIICPKIQRSSLCDLEGKNNGREATSFLKFIIDNYHDLPAHIAFLHGHEEAWHQHYPLSQVLECADYKHHGYISLNDEFIDDRKYPENKTMVRIHELWKRHFEPFLHIPAPGYVLHDCCAQFIVSRERIRKHSVDAYRHWYNMFLEETKDGGYELSVVFEYIWHIIFGEPLVVTQGEHAQRFKTHCLKGRSVTPS